MINVFVRHAKVSGPSGRKIATRLQQLLPLHAVEVGREVDYHDPPEIIINWGGGRSLPTGPTIYNQPGSILASSDKIVALEKLEDAGIQVPSWDLIERWHNGFPQTWNGTGLDIRFPVLVRKRRGKRGLGIRHCESYLLTMQYFRSHDFISEFIQKKHEFRVHVAFGEVVKTSQKVFDPSKGKRRQDIIWNLKHGWVFKNPRVSSDLIERVNGFGIAAVSAIDLDFGAVDIVTDNDEVIWVLETNTAPGLITSTADAYCNKFAEVIQN